MSNIVDIVEVPLTTYFPQLEVTCVDILNGRTRCRLFNVYRKPLSDFNASVAAMEQLICACVCTVIYCIYFR